MSDHTDEKPVQDATEAVQLERERYALMERLERLLDVPMTILAFVWLALLVAELVAGDSMLFETAGVVIWVIFVVNFVLEFTIAPHKLAYLKRNWLIALSLFAPALRVFRAARILHVARAGRGLRLLRVFGSINRGMDALTDSLKRRGFKYILALTLLVTSTGAAGMYAFERRPSGGFEDYWDALWWTAMIMTTMGSQDWPQTAEGRILCVFLAIYAFAVFGYFTAILATFFVGRDASRSSAELAGARQLAELHNEVAALHEELRTLAATRSS